VAFRLQQEVNMGKCESMNNPAEETAMVREAKAEMLSRVKDVARRIQNRVQAALRDTALHLPVPDSTQENAHLPNEYLA
jgi:hypothetical protein